MTQQYYNCSQQDLEWQDLDQLNETEKTKTLVAIRKFLNGHPFAVMEHDPDWLLSKRSSNKSAKLLFLFDSQGDIAAYAPFFIHPSTLNFEILGISLWEYRIRRYSITAGPLFAEKTDENKALSRLFNYLRCTLSDRETLFGLGVELNSTFGQFIQNDVKLRKIFKLIPSGPIYNRRFIKLPSNFDDYLQNLNYKARRDVRRAQRQLVNDSKTNFYYRLYKTVEEVPIFLSLAQEVSDKTYQHRLLGLGIRNNTETTHNLEFAAKRGWLQSYILFCDSEPIAFRHGYLYQNRYYAIQTGYDPTWASKSVGTNIQLHCIHDLISKKVDVLDFLYGDNQKKKSLSNFYEVERNYHLIPKKPTLLFLAYALHGFNSISYFVGNLLEKWNLKSKIRRYLRRQSVNPDSD